MREYVVTLKNYEDLEQFYTKLNTSSSTIKMTAADWKTIDYMYAGK